MIARSHPAKIQRRIATQMAKTEKRLGAAEIISESLRQKMVNISTIYHKTLGVWGAYVWVIAGLHVCVSFYIIWYLKMKLCIFWLSYVFTDEGSSFNKPLVKDSVATLKRTGAPFIQDGPCSEVTPKLSKCRECKMTPTQRSKKIPNIFCRFYAFRR